VTAHLRRALVLLLGYLACVLGIRLVDVIELQLAAAEEVPA
jgi:hypothetical protein